MEIQRTDNGDGNSTIILAKINSGKFKQWLRIDKAITIHFIKGLQKIEVKICVPKFFYKMVDVPPFSIFHLFYS